MNKPRRGERAVTRSLLRPVCPVQAAILDRFRNVLGLQVGSVFEICHRAGYFQDAVVGTGAQALLGHGAFQQAFAVGGEFAVRADVAGRHLGIAVKFFAGGGKALQLFLAGADDSLSNRG